MLFAFIALHFVGLWLFLGLVRFEEWRTQRQVARALAACEVTPPRPTRIITAGADTYRGLAAEVSAPIFTITSLLDGGVRSPTDHGKN